MALIEDLLQRLHFEQISSASSAAAQILAETENARQTLESSGILLSRMAETAEPRLRQLITASVCLVSTFPTPP